MVDYVGLKTELTNDPLSRGYAGMDDAAAAADMNGNSRPLTVSRSVIPGYEIINGTDPTEWEALTTQERQRYQTMITGAGTVDVSNQNVRSAFAKMFPAGSLTRTALASLQTQVVPRSRAQEVFGAPVHPGDVAAARRA